MTEIVKPETTTAPKPREAGDLPGLASFIDRNTRRPKVEMIPPADDKGNVPVVLVPHGFDVFNARDMLRQFRTAPERPVGETMLHDLDSFIAWVNRQKGDSTVIYADLVGQPTLVAVIDHDGDNGTGDGLVAPAFQVYRGRYAFPFSREWKEWTSPDLASMTAGDFAAFLERRIGDVLPPPFTQKADGTVESAIADPEVLKLTGRLGKRLATPEELATLAKGIALNVDSRAKVSTDRDSGAFTVEFSEDSGLGVERVKPPNLFLIAIPPFLNGTPILMAVHLRYRASGTSVRWTLEVHQPERVLETRYAAALETLATQTDVPVLRGQAPGARVTP